MEKTNCSRRPATCLDGSPLVESMVGTVRALWNAAEKAGRADQARLKMDITQTVNHLKSRVEEHLGKPVTVLKVANRPCLGAKETAYQVLTDREMEIARLIAHGHRNSEIARMLYISENTVKTHVAHISTKVGISGRLKIARWWITEMEGAGWRPEGEAVQHLNKNYRRM